MFFYSESFADISFDIRYFESEIQIQTLILLITWHYIMCTINYYAISSYTVKIWNQTPKRTL